MKLKTVPFWVATFLIIACSNPREDALLRASEAQREWRAGNVEAARALISRALQIRDDVADIYLLQARIEASQNNPEGAFEAYRAALALDRVNMEALRGTAQFGLQSGNALAAFEAADQLLLITPNDPLGLFVLGVRALFQRNYEEALSRADKLMEEEPQADLPAVLKARALYYMDRQDEALAVLDRFPDSEPAQLTRLELYREQGNSDEMFRIFSTLERQGKATPRTRIDEAHLRFKTGSPDRANALLVEALSSERIDPNDLQKALSLWSAHGFPDDSVLAPIFDEADADARLALANTLIDAGRATAARRLSRSLNVDDRQAIAARTTAREEQAAQGLALASQVLESDTTHCTALVARAEAFNELGKNDEALISAQQATSNCPRMASGWIAGVEAYDALDQDSGVVRMFRQAIDANPQNLFIAVRYSDWLLEENRTRDAVAAAAGLTLRAPSLTAGWTNYLRVCRRASDDCAAKAMNGLAASRRELGMDLTPQEKLQFGLFGSLKNQR